MQVGYISNATLMQLSAGETGTGSAINLQPKTVQPETFLGADIPNSFAQNLTTAETAQVPAAAAQAYTMPATQSAPTATNQQTQQIATGKKFPWLLVLGIGAGVLLLSKNKKLSGLSSGIVWAGAGFGAAYLLYKVMKNQPPVPVTNFTVDTNLQGPAPAIDAPIF